MSCFLLAVCGLCPLLRSQVQVHSFLPYYAVLCRSFLARRSARMSEPNERSSKAAVRRRAGWQPRRAAGYMRAEYDSAALAKSRKIVWARQSNGNAAHALRFEAQYVSESAREQKKTCTVRYRKREETKTLDLQVR